MEAALRDGQSLFFNPAALVSPKEKRGAVSPKPAHQSMALHSNPGPSPGVQLAPQTQVCQFTEMENGAAYGASTLSSCELCPSSIPLSSEPLAVSHCSGLCLSWEGQSQCLEVTMTPIRRKWPFAGDRFFLIGCFSKL